ncbi:GlsB/YeaQ/YmgE family stress response membrane protein [Citrifermentans bremense]|uniref:GlsB/YeaQ/YmgE family stress response membrane protein n=1 Tax=Citrifermentans bremense TaxID=60035 RepID=UPI00047BF104|nr:GlsB/YeaQ/YmgE family stress response membrane protein [Citrifermentans bremense]
MGILTWIILGLVVGALAKLLMPGDDPGGIFITILLGIAGAFLGGMIGTTLGIGSITGFNMLSIVLAIVGAIILLVLYRVIRRPHRG